MELNVIIAGITGAIAVASLIGGYLRRTSRGAWWLAALAFACAALGGYYNGFWPLVCFAILGCWAFIGGLKVLDGNWRMRFGLVFSITALAAVSLWPTLESMSDGKLPCPA